MAPTVTHTGELLTCGVHYVLQGDFVMTETGDYTLTIFGIGDYVCSIDVSFMATAAASTVLKGDADQNGIIEVNDAFAVLIYVSNHSAAILITHLLMPLNWKLHSLTQLTLMISYDII